MLDDLFDMLQHNSTDVSIRLNVCVCCSAVTPHSKLHFKVYNRYQLKQDVLMGTGKLDMFVLLRQHSGRCQFNNFMSFFQFVSYLLHLVAL